MPTLRSTIRIHVRTSKRQGVVKCDGGASSFLPGFDVLSACRLRSPSNHLRLLAACSMPQKRRHIGKRSCRFRDMLRVFRGHFVVEDQSDASFTRKIVAIVGYAQSHREHDTRCWCLELTRRAGDNEGLSDMADGFVTAVSSISGSIALRTAEPGLGELVGADLA